MAPDAQVAGIGLVTEAEADAKTEVGGLALVAETTIDADVQAGGLALVAEAEIDAVAYIAAVALIIEAAGPVDESIDTAWDNNRLPNPEGWTDGLSFTGKAVMTADKLMHFDVNDRYRTINVRWRSISRTDAEIIRTLATTLNSASITLASMLTATVFPIVDAFRFNPVGGTSNAYDVDVGLWTVTDTE